jgi:pimeloyl-ACP methyl ester carboxylesterase
MTLRKILALVAGTAVFLYGAFLCILYFSQGSIIYPGAKNRVDPTPPRSPGAEVFKVSTQLGRAEALFLPATRDMNDTPQPVAIFAHGNGEVIDDWVTALDGFRRRGIGVLLVEYPGYGRSTGSPSEAAIRGVMDGAYDRIAADPRVDRSRIFGFGQSLGGGAICLLARDRLLRALILQSTFPTLDIFAAGYWAPAFLLRDHFDNLAAVAQFRGPILVIHGRADRLIPWEQGQRLAAASGNSTFRLYDCGHGCWDPERLPFWRDAIPFLLKAGILPHVPAGT